MFRNFIFATLTTMTASLAQASEARIIECGDHWYNVMVEIGDAEAVIYQGGDSLPTPSKITAKAAIGTSSDDGATVYSFTSVGFSPAISFEFRTLNGSTGTGTWTEGKASYDLQNCYASSLL